MRRTLAVALLPAAVSAAAPLNAQRRVAALAVETTRTAVAP